MLVTFFKRNPELDISGGGGGGGVMLSPPIRLYFRLKFFSCKIFSAVMFGPPANQN